MSHSPSSFNEMDLAFTNDTSPYKLTRRTNIAYNKEAMDELVQEIAIYKTTHQEPVAFDDASFSETLEPIPMQRQFNAPQFMVYSNGLLINQDGNITTPEENNTTHEEITETIKRQREMCGLDLDFPEDEGIFEFDEDATSTKAPTPLRIDTPIPPELFGSSARANLPPPITRQTNRSRKFLVYADGVLTDDETGEITTPDDHFTTHDNIMSFIEPYDCFALDLQRTVRYKGDGDICIFLNHSLRDNLLSISNEEGDAHLRAFGLFP